MLTTPTTCQTGSWSLDRAGSSWSDQQWEPNLTFETFRPSFSLRLRHRGRMSFPIQLLVRMHREKKFSRCFARWRSRPLNTCAVYNAAVLFLVHGCLDVINNEWSLHAYCSLNLMIFYVRWKYWCSEPFSNYSNINLYSLKQHVCTLTTPAKYERLDNFLVRKRFA